MTALLCTAAVQACRSPLMVTWPNPFPGSNSQEIPGPGLLCMSRLGPKKAFLCACRLAVPLVQAITCNDPDIQAAAIQVCQSASVCS